MFVKFYAKIRQNDKITVIQNSTINTDKNPDARNSQLAKINITIYKRKSSRDYSINI